MAADLRVERALRGAIAALPAVQRTAVLPSEPRAIHKWSCAARHDFRQRANG